MISVNSVNNSNFFSYESVSQKTEVVRDAIIAIAKRAFSAMIFAIQVLAAGLVADLFWKDDRVTLSAMVVAAGILTYRALQSKFTPPHERKIGPIETFEKAGFMTREDFYHENANARNEGIYKTFVQQLDPNQPHKKHLNDSLYVENVYETSSDAVIDIPDRRALKAAAGRYVEKYGISIHVCSGYGEDTLENMILRLNSKFKAPTYLGIIYENGAMLYGKEYAFGHVTPILLYFPGNGQLENAECVIMDSIGKIDNKHTIEGFGLTSVYGVTKVRQADHSSCRTGALTLLRNALLHLKKNNVQNGFNKVLRHGIGIIELPPEWDYTEQFTNKLLDDTHLAIRSSFSKKVEKQGETAKQFRARHMHSRQFTMKIDYTMVDWRYLKQKAMISSPAPEGLNIEYRGKNDREFHLFTATIKITRNVNDYLLEKGHKLRKTIDLPQENITP